MPTSRTLNLLRVGQANEPDARPTAGQPYDNRWNRFYRRNVLRKLSVLKRGKITLQDDLATTVLGQTDEHCQLHVTVRVHSEQMYISMALGGSIGVAESYMRGEWSCNNLTDLVRILVLNRQVLNEMGGGLARFGMMLHEGLHKLVRRNTKTGSRKNISAHYDLGNDFFRLFLDPTMMYSAAVFTEQTKGLEEASRQKMDRICQKLDLQPNDHLLEIGTGWGGFALHAAQQYGCKVTTTTISQEQYKMARERVLAAGLEGQVEVLQQDYRDLQGQYDKLVSIEMIEAVGHQYFEEYFRTCSNLLKEDGMLLLQAITIDDRRYEKAKKTVDFIQRYIFPGGCLPSISVMCDSLRNTTDMCVYHLEDITRHYATTLAKWREQFFANLDEVKSQGFSDEFVRMWEYYLCYCEGGFRERVIGTVHLVATKPLCRPRDLVAPLV
jgi:cyclopropane-fatty-acyl-phospholipid synthase